MNEFLDNLKRQAEANPLVALGVATALISSINQLAKTRTEARKAVDWSKEIDRRIKIANSK